MAWRGRGRGRPGGFARHDIQLDPDELTASDVPTTFPPADMPPKASSRGLEPETERMLDRFTALRLFYMRSPYHLSSKTAATPAGAKPDVQRFVDAPRCSGELAPGASAPGASRQRQPLHEVIIMHEKYLPAELFSSKQRYASLRRSAGPSVYNAASPRGDQGLEEQLLQMAEQQRRHGDGDDAEGGAAAKKDDENGGDGEGEGDGGGGAGVVEEEDVDDDWEVEDGDYYRGADFDDDDEYGAADDDAGEGEAYF